jgi:hypothetical protein
MYTAMQTQAHERTAMMMMMYKDSVKSPSESPEDEGTKSVWSLVPSASAHN